MKKDNLKNDYFTEDNIYIGTDENVIKLSNFGFQTHKNTKITFTNEYIESLTADERFIKALIQNEEFIKNIKSIVGGNK